MVTHSDILTYMYPILKVCARLMTSEGKARLSRREPSLSRVGRAGRRQLRPERPAQRRGGGWEGWI